MSFHLGPLVSFNLSPAALRAAVCGSVCGGKKRWSRESSQDCSSHTALGLTGSSLNVYVLNTFFLFLD